MTWSEWIRAILNFDAARYRDLQDKKIQAYFNAILVRQKKLPMLSSWLADRRTRVVVGEERAKLRSERKTLERELKALHLHQRRKKT